MIKVRFAPSPTGNLHIGGARTALFNWMYAKAVGGTFVLRIEDTDQQRSKKEYEHEILDSMKWLGLNWDELFYQSERFDVYKEYAQKLIDEGKAYQDGGAVLFKMMVKDIKIYDLIRGEINFDTSNFILRDEHAKPILDENGNTQLKDEVLIKADGSPAYSFCCVIDDALMEISHVIRGEDHISNTPKQLLIYEALGFKPPKYAHLPLIMGESGGRLSKRDGAVAVSDYKRNGFISQAIVNYLLLLGWSPGNNQEIIKIDAAIKKFSIKKVNKAAAVFSMDKLKWINNDYIKKMSLEEVMTLMKDRMQEQDIDPQSFTKDHLEQGLMLYKNRLATLNDFLDWADYLFKDQLIIDPQLREEHLTAEKIKLLLSLEQELSKVDEWIKEHIEAAFKNTAEQFSLKTSDLIHPVRVALTGKDIGPSLYDIIVILGKEITLNRLQALNS